MDRTVSVDIVVSGTVENQGCFYDYFDHIVLLNAPMEDLLERVVSRTNNPYGKAPSESEEIRRYQSMVEPLLAKGATLILDSRRTVSILADCIEALA